MNEAIQIVLLVIGVMCASLVYLENWDLRRQLRVAWKMKNIYDAWESKGPKEALMLGQALRQVDPSRGLTVKEKKPKKVADEIPSGISFKQPGLN